MLDEDAIADELVPGRSKRSKSYHGDYGKLTYREIRRRASARPPDPKARQMKKLIEQSKRLGDKPRKPQS